MNTKILQLVASYLKNRAQGSLLNVIAPIGPILKQVTFGLAAIVMSLVCFLFTLFFFALSFFFYLIERGDWSVAGLWTGLVLALIGLVFALIGRSALTDIQKNT